MSVPASDVLWQLEAVPKAVSSLNTKLAFGTASDATSSSYLSDFAVD